jgi:hypothetical protein
MALSIQNSKAEKLAREVAAQSAETIMNPRRVKISR